MTDVRLKVHDISTNPVFIAELLSVNSLNFSMKVKLRGEGGRVVENIKINQTLTQSSARAVFMPIPGQTYVILIKSSVDETGFTHLGYYTPVVAEATTDPFSLQEGSMVYQRSLNPGEFHVVSVGGTELYMPESGDFFVKNSKGYFIRFSAFMDNLEIHVPDVNIQSYSVNVKSGRVTRPSKSDLIDDIKRRNIQADPGSGTLEDKSPFVEYTIDVGTIYDSATSLPKGVSVGSLSLADRVFDVTGANPTAYQGASAFLQFLLQMSSGLKVSVDEKGDLHVVSSKDNTRLTFGVGAAGSSDAEITYTTSKSKLSIDANTFSFVNTALGYFLRFNAVSPEESSLVIRIGDNTFVLDSAQGLQISPASGGGITFSAEGGVTLNDKAGHIVMLNDDGIIINGDKTNVNVFGNVLNVLTKNGLSVGDPNMAINGVLASTPTASAFDTHTHAGPGAPPLIPWSVPAYLQTLIAKGVKVG